MTAADLRKVMHAIPFRPFEIGLDDGRRFVVPDPIHVAISDPGNLAIVTNSDDDHFKFVALPSIARLTVAPSPL
jgi:hypothetical protein